MKFAKAHGTGNDFVVLPDPDGALDLTPDLIRALCDRRRGVGGDGVLRVVRSAKHPDAAAMAADAEWFMDYHNSDGSVAEMCGNGVRAYARYLVDSGLAGAGLVDSGPVDAGLAGPGPVDPGLADSDLADSAPASGGSDVDRPAEMPGPLRLAIATRAGIVSVLVGPEAISVDLPLPVIGGPGSTVVAGATFAGMSVAVGNPNLVCRVVDTDSLARLDLTRPPALDSDAFPAGANIEFIAAGAPIVGADLRVHMRVFERGVGETQSCGSGACAAAAVVLREAGRADGVVAIDVPGGRLTVTLGDTCRLTGPATVIATGDLNPDALGDLGVFAPAARPA